MSQGFIKIILGAMGFLCWGDLGHAMNLEREEARLAKSLNRWTTKTTDSQEKTIQISSNHPRLQLPEEDAVAQFRKDLRLVNQILKDLTEDILQNSNYYILKNVKTFGFVFLYYTSIKEFPELTTENLTNQAVVLYEKSLISVENKNDFTVEDKQKIIRLIISQLFNPFEKVFSNSQKRGIFDSKISNMDGLGFRFPMVESAENIIPSLNFRNIPKLLNGLEDSFNNKEMFRLKFRKYLEENYHPSEQVKALLQAPWTLVVQLAYLLSDLKQESPSLYKQQGQKFMNALNDQLACYLAAANKFLYEGTLLATEIAEEQDGETLH